MNRLLAVVGFVTLAAAVFVSGADAARVFPGKMQFEPLRWRTSAANSRGFVDSAYAHLNGAVQTTDTTFAFETRKIAPWMGLESGGQASNALRFWLYSSSGTVASVDTLFVTYEGSYDGSTWYSAASAVNFLVASGSKTGWGVPITFDTDAAMTSYTPQGGALLNFPLIRLLVRADGNTGALFPYAQVFVSYMASDPTTDVDALVAGAWKWEPLKFRVSAANTAGYIDSSYVATVGGVAVNMVDTTAAFPLGNVAMLTQVATGTASEPFKLYIQASGSDLTGMDTLTVAQEISVDGTNWIANATLGNNVDYAGAGNTLAFPVLGVATNGATSAWGAPYVRWRIRTDPNTTVAHTLQCWVGYHAYQ